MNIDQRMSAARLETKILGLLARLNDAHHLLGERREHSVSQFAVLYPDLRDAVLMMLAREPKAGGLEFEGGK